jgi:hypothetical protein
VSWEGRLLAQLAVDPARAARSQLGDSAAALLEQQRRSWPLLAQGYAALAAVETRRLQVRASMVTAQHNPARRVSTTADVAAAAAGRRPCFLCPQQLPPEEKGIAFGAELVLLCNPFPILDRHLSIVHREHVPQRLAGRVDTMLALAQALGPDYFVLYNGPRCGASAPDHFHFQAARRVLPIEEDAAELSLERAAGSSAAADAGFWVLEPRDRARSVLVLRASSRDGLRRWIEAFVAALPAAGQDEPLLNIVCAVDQGSLSAYVFPRARHRPSSFDANGDERLVVSPGAIDMAGVLVVPDRDDFVRLDAEKVARVYAEVSLAADRVREAAARVAR